MSTTDPDAHSMTSDGRATGVVGYNVQAAVDTKHHLIVAHEVITEGSDRGQLASMAEQARAAMGKTKLQAIADRGYFSGPQIKTCEDCGITAYVPKPMTSNSKAAGRVSKADFVYAAATTSTSALRARGYPGGRPPSRRASTSTRSGPTSAVVVP